MTGLVFKSLLATVCIIFGALVLFIADLNAGLPDLPEPGQCRTAGELVTAPAVPKRFGEAVAAAEQPDFYDVPAAMSLGLGAAINRNVIRPFAQILVARRSGEPFPLVARPTITYQIANHSLMSSPKLERTFQVMLLTVKIDGKLSRDHILRCYSHLVYFGRHTSGLANASIVYFSKLPDDLSVAETAFLAGILKAPSMFDPGRNPKEAKERRDAVLSKMTQLGFVSEEEAANAKAQPLATLPIVKVE